MGNSITQEEIEQMPDLFDKIMGIPCPELDIGNSTGLTGYIDFINPQNVSGAMMKGIDCYSRRFIVWKAQIIIMTPDTDINTDPVIWNTFSTFFKRYPEQTSHVYHVCGNYGQNLLSTEGGATLKQMEFLYNFLSKGYAELDIDQANSIKLRYPVKFADDGTPNTNGWIFKIKLVDR